MGRTKPLPKPEKKSASQNISAAAHALALSYARGYTSMERVIQSIAATDDAVVASYFALNFVSGLPDYPEAEIRRRLAVIIDKR